MPALVLSTLFGVMFLNSVAITAVRELVRRPDAGHLEELTSRSTRTADGGAVGTRRSLRSRLSLKVIAETVPTFPFALISLPTHCLSPKVDRTDVFGLGSQAPDSDVARHITVDGKCAKDVGGKGAGEAI